jgi:hypothetical protein
MLGINPVTNPLCAWHCNQSWGPWWAGVTPLSPGTLKEGGRQKLTLWSPRYCVSLSPRVWGQCTRS